MISIYEMYAYHITWENNLIKKYGLLSPYDLYKYSPKDFHKTTYENYKIRAAEYLNKKDVTDEDVIKYLDSNKRKPFTSRTLFFSFIPKSQMPYIQYGNIEYKIDLDIIKKFSTKKPILILGKHTQEIDWDLLKNEKYIQQAISGAKKEPKLNLKYKYIIHFAVDCNPIPYQYLQEVI